MEKGFILWFMGLSGVGKIIISKIVVEKLK